MKKQMVLIIACWLTHLRTNLLLIRVQPSLSTTCSNAAQMLRRFHGSIPANAWMQALYWPTSAALLRRNLLRLQRLMRGKNRCLLNKKLCKTWRGNTVSARRYFPSLQNKKTSQWALCPPVVLWTSILCAKRYLVCQIHDCSINNLWVSAVHIRFISKFFQ